MRTFSPPRLFSDWLHQHGLVEQLHAGIDGLDGRGRHRDQPAHLQDGADQRLGLQRAAGLDVLQHGGLVLADRLGALDALFDGVAEGDAQLLGDRLRLGQDRKSTRLNSSPSCALFPLPDSFPIGSISMVLWSSFTQAETASMAGAGTATSLPISRMAPTSASVSSERPASTSCSMEVLCLPTASAPSMRFSMVWRKVTPSFSAIACASAIMVAASRRVSGKVQMSRSEEHTSELQSLMRISYAVFCLKTKKNHRQKRRTI